MAKIVEKNNHLDSNMEAKPITDKDLNKFKNIIEDNKKIYNVQQALATTTEEVERLHITLGDLLEELTQIKIDVDDVESRLHEKFELLNDKFDLFLDEIMKNQDLNSLVDILLKNPQFQERVMERILYNQGKRKMN
ncbi:MAG TPA: hypothetical protein VGB37_01360 [Candidatus Lokiarchaeia archaeon]